MRRRASKINESPILKMFIDTLEPLVAQQKLMYIRHHPIRLVTSKKTGKTFTVPVNPSQLGAPDLIIFLPGECWGVETKGTRGKLSDDQKRWRHWFMTVAQDDEYRYFIPSSIGEASQMIDFLLKVAK